MPKSEKILVIRRDNIGDLVCTTPAIAAIRRHYPNAEIAALVNSYNVDVLLGNPDLDKIFVYQKVKHVKGSFRRLCSLVKRMLLILELRIWKADVIILAKASYDRHGLNFARLVGAKKIVGYGPVEMKLGTMLPDLVVNIPDFSSVHEVEAINKLLRPLGIVDALGPLRVYPCPEKVAEYEKRLKPGALRIAVHISAREPERRWGAENYIELLEWLLFEKSNIEVLLFWSPGGSENLMHPGDDEMASIILNKFNSERLVQMPTKTVSELVAGLSLCEIFIGTDGGALHLSVGLGKFVIGLFENNIEKTNHWYPWKRHGVVVTSKNSKNPDISNIKVSQVVEAYKNYNAINVDL